MQDLSNLVCVQPACPLSSTGHCLEGLDDPHRCPHVKPNAGESANDVEESVDSEEATSDTSDWLAVIGGYELTVDEASAITSDSDASVVMFAGEPDAGKTTLLATIYELLSSGGIPEFRFAGTETMLAFERACFPSRIASKNLKPDTVRTRHPRPRFYHLCLRQQAGDDTRKHLLLGDVSGETFKRASDDDTEARKLHLLRRVDAFVLILDGDKLRNRKERQDVVERGLLILRSLLEAEVLLQHTTVQILVSKFDCFAPGDQNETKFLEHLRQEFTTRFSGSFAQLTINEIAARPENDRFRFGHGVSEIMQPWLSDKDLQWPKVLPPIPNDSTLREAEAYLWRTSLGKNNA
jgi:hypothetical protein